MHFTSPRYNVPIITAPQCVNIPCTTMFQTSLHYNTLNITTVQHPRYHCTTTSPIEVQGTDLTVSASHVSALYSLGEGQAKARGQVPNSILTCAPPPNTLV